MLLQHLGLILMLSFHLGSLGFSDAELTQSRPLSRGSDSISLAAHLQYEWLTNSCFYSQSNGSRAQIALVHFKINYFQERSLEDNPYLSYGSAQQRQL